MASSNRVAVVGYAHSDVQRHADTTLGVSTVQTARRAIADAGLTPADVDGFVTASLFPSAGAHAAVDGISLVSANWLAEHLGVNPNYAAGFQGFGQLPGAVAMAVNAVVSGPKYPCGTVHCWSPRASVIGLAWYDPRGLCRARCTST